MVGVELVERFLDPRDFVLGGLGVCVCAFRVCVCVCVCVCACVCVCVCVLTEQQSTRRKEGFMNTKTTYRRRYRLRAYDS